MVSDVAEDTPRVSLVSVLNVPILLAIPGAPIIDDEDVVDIVIVAAVIAALRLLTCE